MARDMKDLPAHAPNLQGLSSLQLPMYREFEGVILEPVLRLAHLFEHLHTVHRPVIALLNRLCLEGLDPEFRCRYFLEYLGKAADVIEVRVRHNDPLYRGKLHSGLDDGLEFIVPSPDEASIDKGEVFR